MKLTEDPRIREALDLLESAARDKVEDLKRSMDQYVHLRDVFVDNVARRVPGTAERIIAHTRPEDRELIRMRTEANIARFIHSPPEDISRRLEEIDQEWDVERILMANAAGVSLTGMLLAETVDSRWRVLPGMVALFLLQHAVEGWCPPLTVLRRMGIRTAQEIDAERYALKTIRGDFSNARADGDNPQAQARALLELQMR